MVRKQLYLHDRQDRALKDAAEAAGVSEAEVVRRALDRYLDTGGSDDELEALLATAAESRHRLAGRWDRAALYERSS